VSAAHDLARNLLGYDRRLAEGVLELIVAELGGPLDDAETDVAGARAFLANVPAGPRLARVSDVSEAPSTTEEWKSEFRHENRLRELGLELANVLEDGS
jgi:hypothetical protein